MLVLSVGVLGEDKPPRRPEASSASAERQLQPIRIKLLIRPSVRPPWAFRRIGAR
jgi:hypothetical protein